MLVSITDFASVWRCRQARNAGNSDGARTVYYNTTGVEVNGKVRQRPEIIGYARFHTIGGFDPNRLHRMIHRVFECSAPCVWLGQNKILFERKLSAPAIPDAFLVVTQTATTGALKVGATDWRSAGVWLISLSQCRDRQEALLLMPAYGWVQTELGKFALEPSAARPWVARLMLVPGQRLTSGNVDATLCRVQKEV